MHSIEISILKTVAYFDVFSYPLSPSDIIFFLDQPVSEAEIKPALEQLVKTKNLWQFDKFYSIRNNAELIKRRTNGNKLAVKQIEKAKRIARFLSWFPYIRGIAISGSLSKHFADEKSDIDFFIITAANRLWIVRILYTVLFKIASLLRIKEWFCLNYFIDELNLEIKEHNLFTAVEGSTLLPLKGNMIFQKFFYANKWIEKYFPNYEPDYKYLNDTRPFFLKKVTEWMMNVKAGNRLDNKLLSIFQKRFTRMIEENVQTEKGLTIGAYEAEKHACRPLPQYFQPKILDKFYERFDAVKENYRNTIAAKEKSFSK